MQAQSELGTQPLKLHLWMTGWTIPCVVKGRHNGSFGKSIRSDSISGQVDISPSCVLERRPVPFNQNSTWLVASSLRSGRDGDFRQEKIGPVKEKQSLLKSWCWLFHNFLERLFGTLQEKCLFGSVDSL